MESSTLPDLGAGIEYLTIAIPVDMTNPRSVEEIRPTVVDLVTEAYAKAVAARMEGDAR